MTANLTHKLWKSYYNKNQLRYFVLKIHIDLDEVHHVLSAVGSSVDLSPVLGCFGPLTINTPLRWGPAVIEHHFSLVSFIILHLLITLDLLLLHHK